MYLFPDHTIFTNIAYIDRYTHEYAPYLLVVMDCCSRYIDINPVKSPKATIIKPLFEKSSHQTYKNIY